jgi:signal transduction protein with GAF and PtsI domain
LAYIYGHAGLTGLVGERRQLVVLNNESAHPRYDPADETGGKRLDVFLGVPLIHFQQLLGVLVAWKHVGVSSRETRVEAVKERLPKAESRRLQ